MGNDASRAAGWYDDATSWRYVFAAQSALQQSYASWLELRAAVEEGRAQWYGGAAKVPEAQARNYSADAAMVASGAKMAVVTVSAKRLSSEEKQAAGARG